MNKLKKIIFASLAIISMLGCSSYRKDDIFSEKYSHDYNKYVDSAWTNRLVHTIDNESSFDVSKISTLYQGNQIPDSVYLFPPITSYSNQYIFISTERNSWDGATLSVEFKKHWQNIQLLELVKLISNKFMPNLSEEELAEIYSVIGSEIEEGQTSSCTIDRNARELIVTKYGPDNSDETLLNIQVDFLSLTEAGYSSSLLLNETEKGRQELAYDTSYEDIMNSEDGFKNKYFEFDFEICEIEDYISQTELTGYLNNNPARTVKIWVPIPNDELKIKDNIHVFAVSSGFDLNDIPSFSGIQISKNGTQINFD